MTDSAIWVCIELGNTLCETLICYLFYKDFLGKNTSIKRYIHIIGFLAVFLSSGMLYLICSDAIITVSVNIITKFLYALLFKDNLKSKSFATILLVSQMVVSEMMTLYLITILLKVSVEVVTHDGFYRLFGIAISIIISLIITKVLCMAKKHKKLTIPTWYWIILLTAPFLSIVTIITLFTYNNIINNSSMKIYSCFTAISILYINFTIFYLFNKIIDDFNLQTQYKLLEQQIDYQMNHYKDLEISNKEIRSLKHDIRNHLQCLDELIRTNKNIEADNYIKSVANILTVNNYIVTTGNSVLDSILNTKFMLINTKKIKIDYTIEIPENIKIEPVDICVIFGNSLDNAIEACERMHSEIQNISMIISYRNNSLIYSLSNSTNRQLVKSGKYFLSSKNNFLEHGFGISNIERAVERYNGILKIEDKKNIFQLSMILYDV